MTTITDEQVRALIARASEYFQHGGLFNPELMQHERVRDLIYDMRAALASVQREGVKMPGTVVYMETHGGHAQEPLIIRSEMIAALKAAGAEIVE